MQEAGLRPSKLTNAWAPFLVASTRLLTKHGRLAMVIPAELLQVSYAAEVRQFLSDQYSKITLVTFRKLVFDGIQQEVVLVLGERNGDEHTGIRTVEMDDIEDLSMHEHTTFGEELKPLDHGREKWTRYFLTANELDLLRRIERHPGLTLSGKVIDVDVGVVTGLNAFFVLTSEQVDAHGLQEHTSPVVSRSAHLGGLVFGASEWQHNAVNSLPSHLLALPDVPRDQLSPKVRAYVEAGEKRGIHTGYKCRIRKNWWTVPSVWAPDAFMLRQIHGYPKLIVNEAGATSTDTIHRVRLRNGTSARIVAAAMINSLTFAFAEVVGRSYGGGVLELEPTEAEKLPIPMCGAESIDLAELDRLLVAGHVEQALDMADKVLLVEGLGLTLCEAMTLRGIWQKLRGRRAGRR
jgi:adenine-specific DNA-methyltransferase